MANDKDFILKNAVEVGGPTNVTLGTITSSDIDLSTGNYFSDTLAANTTYTISNAGDVQSFQLEVTGAVKGYELSGAAYDSVSFSVSSQESGVTALSFKPDGTVVYVVGTTNDTVYQYSLSTAWDLSSASYGSVNFYVAGQEASPTGLMFKSDGTKMYIVGISSDTIYQYSLSTAWNVSTASYDSVSFSVSSQDTSPRNIQFKSDGTKLYVTGYTNDTIYQYSLSTAYDLSTASYDSVSLSVTSQDTAPTGIFFKSDGTKMYMVGQTNKNIFQYTLSTAWDLSTASYDSVSFSFATQDNAPCSIAFSNSGTKMYMLGQASPAIYQYSTVSAYTITWPSSIEWGGGVSPAAPAAGETDVFTITTDDGGTTYTGVKTADNLS